MSLGVERTMPAKRILYRMRRIDVRARHPSCRNRFGGRMREPTAQQFWEQVRVRPFGTAAIRRWNRLIDFDAPEPAGKYAMRTGAQDRRHGGICRIEHGAPDAG